MFRPLRRTKQALPEEICKALLHRLPRGVLSLLGEEGYPYGIPMNHYYIEEKNALYFHGAKEGHKIEAMLHHPKAGYCCIDEGERQGEDWPLHFQSVIVFGEMEEVRDEAEKEAFCRLLCQKFNDNPAYIEKELKGLAHTRCWRLHIAHISGKRVKES